MHNYFITQYRDWRRSLSKRDRLVNRVLKKIGVSSQLVNPRGDGRMTNVEQRINLFHLVSQVLAYNVPGDLVELGTSRGQTAVLFAQVMAEYAPYRSLHLYDTWPNAGTLRIVEQNFAEANLSLPELHHGTVEATIPSQLPDQICFANIDLGSSNQPNLKELLVHCLEHIYPRLSEGGICVMQSYCDPSIYPNLAPFHRPAAKAAADEFFQDKPERMSVMYAGQFFIYAHAFFRKGDPH